MARSVLCLQVLLVKGLAPRQARVTLRLEVIHILLELAIVGCLDCWKAACWSADTRADHVRRLTSATYPCS